MSMFPALMAYRIEPSFIAVLSACEEALKPGEFVPCGASQESSSGWTPPRSEKHAALIEAINGQWLMQFTMEEKPIPGALLRRRVDERCDQIEQETGRQPGKKERKQIKEDLTQEMLPMAFPKRSVISVWLDPQRGLLLIGSTSQTKADAIITSLVKHMPSMGISAFITAVEPGGAMTGWLGTQEPPNGFTIDRDCTLQATDESKATIRYSNVPLDTEEVVKHIEGGKRAIALAMTWQDRISFTMSEGGALKGITLLEGVHPTGASTEEQADAFDGSVTIETAELRALLADIVEVLGGLTEQNPIPPTQTDMAGDVDVLLHDAARIVRENGKASISLVQRHLRIGYNRAARLLEDLERQGVVSAMDSQGQRTVLAERGGRHE